MVNEVPFTSADEAPTPSQSYRPVPIPPRGEIVAWLFTILLAALNFVLFLQIGRLPFWAPLFSILSLLLALSIRLSRWLEANTFIHVAPEGIRFSSPIRMHQFAWHQINQMTVYKAGNGWRVSVLADQGGFRFQTATILRGMRGAEMRTGYPGGDKIVRQILRNVDFGEPGNEGSTWVWQTK
jgi:hypothetical protein